MPSRDARPTLATSPAATRPASPATYASSSAGVAAATTITGFVSPPGKRTAMLRCTCTLANDSGSRSAPPFCSRSDSTGAPAASRSTAATIATGHGRRCTNAASRDSGPWSEAIARRCRMRRPATASSAGISVSAASSATSTTAVPAAPMARKVGSSKRNSADRQTATVRAENAIVRPAVAAVRSTAAATSSPAARSSRNRLTMSRE